MTIPIDVRAEDPAGADALALVAELSAALGAITGDSGQASFDVADVRGPRACFALARDAHGRALGCGALRPLEGDVAEVKRMFARPGTRGVGSAVLRFLEVEAARHGYLAVRLSTRLVNGRAVGFYERHGYRRIPGYGRYAGSEVSVCFEKALPG
ncbi:GNAT family N-acetyltransferase [Scleromatobacter humisilvae]|uniref:GNAT family N-acetyltransferase n=1 Tax=Scleromatobacter humisilvae TaxID=2897159 RepID=A0A9X2C205_9BURK|nr:GNAT family N-acetyltransferase [Scleromatobacter humisilvae]MCK9688757.1 GNAT family N-acetyltransferase [Scleromatobacter humisilvae]